MTANGAAALFEHDFLFLRSTAQDGRSYNGFRWPDLAGEMVEAPDWDPTPKCGGGLHGLEAGLGDWALMAAPADQTARWYVCGARRDQAVSIDGSKIKVPRCRVLYVGHLAGAMELIAACDDGRDARARTEPAGCCCARGRVGHPAREERPRPPAKTGSQSLPATPAAEWSPTARSWSWSSGTTTGTSSATSPSRAGENGVEPGRWYTLRGGALVDVTDEAMG